MQTSGTSAPTPEAKTSVSGPVAGTRLTEAYVAEIARYARSLGAPADWPRFLTAFWNSLADAALLNRSAPVYSSSFLCTKRPPSCGRPCDKPKMSTRHHR
jgi:hypothetical protein